MSLDDIFAGIQPQAGARAVDTGDGIGWETVTPTHQSNEPNQSYLDSLFSDGEKKADWKTAPPVTQPKDEGFLESAWNMGKTLASAATALPQAAYDWGEGFLSNKQTERGITNLSEYENRMGRASSDIERQQAQQDMLQKGIITQDYFKQKQDTIAQKEGDNQKFYQQAQAGFKDELAEAVKPYLNQANKMQQKYILAAIERETSQYGALWNSINDSYDGSEFNKKDYFNKLNTEVLNGIKDTVVNFSQKIMEGKDSQAAYNELLPTMTDTFSSIAQFGMDIADKSNLASREHFYGKISTGIDPMALIGFASSYVQGATQDFITKPMEYLKQTVLGDYDVVEDLQRMGVYSDTASMWEKAGATFSKVGGNIISGAPQIAAIAPIVAAELAIGNVPALAMLTKGSKIRTALGELSKDTLLYNGMAQAALGRGMTEKDMAENFMFDGPIDATLGLMEKPIKKELDNVWKAKFGSDYGFTPSETVSQDTLNLINAGHADAAMVQHTADVTSGKPGDIAIDSLDSSLRNTIGNMQSNIKQVFDKLPSNETTLKEDTFIDNAARAVLESKSSNDILESSILSEKITAHAEQAINNPNSTMGQAQPIKSIDYMLQRGALKPNELNQFIDSAVDSLAETKLGSYNVSSQEAKEMGDFIKHIFQGEGSIPSQVTTPEKLKLFNAIKNEVHKQIALTRTPGTTVGRYVVKADGEYFDKITGNVISKSDMVLHIDNFKIDTVNRNRLQNIYKTLSTGDRGINYSEVFGLTEIMNQQQNAELSNFINSVSNIAFKVKDSDKSSFSAALAGRVKLLLDGNTNMARLDKHDVALIRVMMLPDLISKGKLSKSEIVNSNAWKIFNDDGSINIANANKYQVGNLLMQPIKDGDMESLVAVAHDIKGIDKNITNVKEAGSFKKAFDTSIEQIKQPELKKSVSRVPLYIPTVKKVQSNEKEFFEFFAENFADKEFKKGESKLSQSIINVWTWSKKQMSTVEADKIFIGKAHVNKERVKEYESIISKGEVLPIVIWENYPFTKKPGETKRFVTDGNHKLQAYMNLGYKEIPYVSMDDIYKKFLADKEYTSNVSKYNEVDNVDDIGMAVYEHNISGALDISTIEGAKILHEIVDTIANDKVLSEAVSSTEEIIKQEMADGIVKGITLNKSRKIKSLNINPEVDTLKKNVGGVLIGNTKMPPMKIESPEDQVKAITAIMKANGVGERVFIDKVVDSIGTIGVLPFDKVQDLTIDSISKLISWSRAEVLFKTGTLSDVKNGLPRDIKNFIAEVEALKTSTPDPIELYKNILRTKYNYSTKLYSYILGGETGKYVNELYELLQASRDVRFLSSTARIDKFIDSVRADLLKIDISEIKSLTFKEFDKMNLKESKFLYKDKRYSVKRGKGEYFIKNGTMPPYIATQDIKVSEVGNIYIVVNPSSVDEISNPIRVSGMNKDYKFISMDELLNGQYDKGSPVYISKRYANRVMTNDTDKLTVRLKNDINVIMKNLVANDDVRIFDMDVYMPNKEVIIQPSDISIAKNMFTIKTMESDIAYDNAIKTVMDGFSTDTINNELNQESKKYLEYISTLDTAVRTDEPIKNFFAQFDITQKSIIDIQNVIAVMMNDLYKYGPIYRTILRDSTQDLKKTTFVKLENIATSYGIRKEYNKFLSSLPANPDLTINNVNINDMFISLLEENENNLQDSFIALYQMMINNRIPLKDIREGMTSVLQIYGFEGSLPSYLHQVIYPTIDVFRGQQVVDAVLSSIGGKKKAEVVDIFNSSIKKHLEQFNVTHFGNDVNMTRFIESVQKLGYIDKDINIYTLMDKLGAEGDKIKYMLKQIYNSDVARLIDDAEGYDTVYQSIANVIGKIVDVTQTGSTVKHKAGSTVGIEGITDEEMQAIEKDLAIAQEEGEVPEFIRGGISNKPEIDISNIILDFKKSIDEMLQEEADMLKIKGEYSNTGKRNVVWSDTSTFRIAGFAAQDKEQIISTLQALQSGLDRNKSLKFTRPIRGGTSKRQVSFEIKEALTQNTASNLRDDAFRIIEAANIADEKKFIAQTKPTIIFNDKEMVMTGTEKLETANFVSSVLDRMIEIQTKVSDVKYKDSKEVIDYNIFTMKTDTGVERVINSDSLKNFPIWKGYLNRLYTSNPGFFDGPLNDVFLFSQLEQLRKYTANVLVDINKKYPGKALLETGNTQLKTYNDMYHKLDTIINNYSTERGIARTGFENTMFETKSYAGALESLLMKKGGLAKILPESMKDILTNVTSIEVVGYTPIIRYRANGEDAGFEMMDRIIPVEKIEETLENMADQFVNKTENHPADWLEEMGYDLRVHTKGGKTYAIKIHNGIEELTEIKLTGDTYKKLKEPIQDINHFMEPATAKEYQTGMSKFTCDN